mmetsp:Transcript_32946/g.79699  ORF Transcript_32946/g.79699 Transcript_32946/m.79699 type:complete len:289 (-) Transcript_32946:447-1313(-)
MPNTKAVVVVRHGERLDYIMRDRGENWIPTTDRPWDPPLTENGKQQANALGMALPSMLKTLNLPSIAAVYSSPFHRCRQTAAELCASDDKLKVQVELGLAESINQNWFRSWAIEGTDGTWGYGKKECPDANDLDPSKLHPLSRQPVQPLLDWKQGAMDEELEKKMDVEYESKSSVETPYSLHPPLFENYNVQRKRMHEALSQLSELHNNETIMLVSHGGPVTHLYESLTGNNWNLHGVSKYCCYSIYQQEEGDDKWKPLVVNQVLGQEAEPTEEEDAASNPQKEFTWA